MGDDRLRIHGRLLRGDLELDVELDLPVGRIAVVGPNGSGKSSLLRLIAGLEALDDGDIVLDGAVLDEPASGLFVPPEHRPTAMAFQQPRLFPHLRALDNVAYPLRRSGLEATTARARAVELLASVGADELGDRRPSQLSGGQAQRVALARTLARDADTILLDEPLATIDESGRAEVGAMLRGLDRRRTVWVTHDPVDASDADVVVSIAGGVVSQTDG